MAVLLAEQGQCVPDWTGNIDQDRLRLSIMHNLPPRTVRALSAEADVAPATVHRRLDGLPVRASTCERIERAAQKLGVKLPPRAASEPGSPSSGDAA